MQAKLIADGGWVLSFFITQGTLFSLSEGDAEMIITKILNNNGYLSHNEKGEEIIVMGRGAAFGRKAGQDVELPPGAQIFSMKNSELNEQMMDIVSNIPIEYMGITEKAVNILKKEYNRNLHDIIYITLTEHIHSAVERFKEGILIDNPLLSQIRRIYREEYDVALRTLDFIKEEFNIEFPKDEAGFIAYHFVNAQLDGEINNIAEITKIAHEILNVVRYQMQIEFDEDSLAYDRFVTHLKYFAQRVVSTNTYQDEDDEIFDILSQKYTRSYKCCTKIQKLIESRYHYKISKEELSYLIIHLERVTNNRK